MRNDGGTFPLPLHRTTPSQTTSSRLPHSNLEFSAAQPIPSHLLYTDFAQHTLALRHLTSLQPLAIHYPHRTRHRHAQLNQRRRLNSKGQDHTYEVAAQNVTRKKKKKKNHEERKKERNLRLCDSGIARVTW
uniref:Uncharacterized protein n=1 Tax=Trypanosoma vivax (strain Y486) TaxID=1055687 RepID=G0UC50_TRYVY|nr:hypothetical protein, unlikely [Trypanosoma vivax Y486]